MKTSTLVICFLLSAIASYATAPAIGHAGAPANVIHAGNHPPAAPFTICLEAENGNGDGPISADPNASGGLTRGAQNSPDYFVDYQTDVPSTAKFQVTLRYYAERNSLVNVSVNGGEPFQVELPSSHAWNINWAEHTIEANLVAGNNRIRIQELPGYDVRQDKACWTEMTSGCDFEISASVSDNTPNCSEEITFSGQCTGPDCAGVRYGWGGGGLNTSGQTITVPAPSAAGTYTYFITGNKDGCTGKAVNFPVVVSCESTPTEPFSACIEAENSSGDGEITSDPNASGGLTRGAENGPNYYVEYQVNGVKATGIHQVTLRYYSPQQTGVVVSVNGVNEIPLLGLGASGAWNVVWTEQVFRLTLKEGSNTIRIYSGYGDPVIRQDRICVTGPGGTGNPPSCDFNITTYGFDTGPVACSASVSAALTCSGFDCPSVSYQWSGNGLNSSMRSVSISPPQANGTYTYTLTASKNGCPSVVKTIDLTVSGCGPSGPFNACTESEFAESNSPITSDPNASNGQTRGTQDNYDYYVDYKLFDVPATGQYPVTLRYYAESSAQVSVLVNGSTAIANLQLPPSNSWNIVWREETFLVPMPAGNNTIRIQGLPGAAVRQDKFCVASSPGNARMAAPDLSQSQSDVPLLQAYPNPAPGEFKASFHLKTGEAATIRITDVQGKIWHTRSVSGKGAHEERITLDNAPAGIYLLQVKKPDSVETKKILLTR